MWRWLKRILKPSKPVILLAMRLDDMFLMHPDMDDTRHCGRCGARLGLYPSGQAVLKQHPNCELVCHVCLELTADVRPAPGALAEMGESHPRSR